MLSSLVDEFEAERPRLLNVAYRITGSVADAEDAVQEAWLRLNRSAIDSADEEIQNLQAWLTRTVSRLCLDRLKSAAVRRETYTGTWLPEPLVTDLGSSDPLTQVLSHDDTRFAAMVVLEVLSPDQRVAFVLHDAYDVPFADIADVLSIEPAAARQLASRARKAVGQPPPPVSDAEHNEAVGRFLAAMATGNLDAIVATLHPDALLMGDANGHTSTAVNVIQGADKFVRFFLGLMKRYGDGVIEELQPVLVNGQLGLATAGWAEGTYKRASPARVAGFTVRDGLVWTAYDIANPDKHSGVRLANWHRQ